MIAALALVSVAYAGFDVSSMRKDSRSGPSPWGAGAALDSDPATCWMIDGEQDNEGSWIALDVPASEVDKISIVSGWDKSEDSFFDYARIKLARVEVLDMNNGETVVVDQQITLEDKRGWQHIDLTNGKVGGEVKGGRVRVTVLEVYPGKDYANVAVSEVRVGLKEFPAETGKLTSPPESIEAGHAAELLLDGKDTTFWASEPSPEGNPTFKVAAPGYGLASIGIRPGPAPYGRPKTLVLTANDAKVTVTVEDKAVVQWFTLPVIVGYTGGAWGNVSVEITETYPGTNKGVAIAEVKLNAATIEEF